MVAAQLPVRNSPRFAEFAVEDGDSSFYIFVEQMTLCETSTFTKALFLWFCVHSYFTFPIQLHSVTFVLFSKNLFLDCLQRVNVVHPI